MERRITWVDNFKFFCIFAVMAEHAICMTGYTDAINSPFYINGFFFASGYLYTHRKGFWTFLKKRTRQLLLPWLIFSLFIIFSAQIFSYEGGRDLRTALINNFLQIRSQGDEMWFVAALFVASIPFYFVIDYCKDNRQRTCAVLVSLLILSVVASLFMEGHLGNTICHFPWHIEYVPKSLLLMLAGFLFRHRFEEKFDVLNTRRNRIVLGVVYFVIIFIPQFTHHVYDSDADRTLFVYIAAVIGIAFVVSISKMITENCFMSFIGRNTIAYYGLHGKIESVIHYTLGGLFGAPYYAMCWNNLTEFGPLCKATLLSYAVALVASVILILPVYVLERWFPFVLGKKKNNSP